MSKSTILPYSLIYLYFFSSFSNVKISTSFLGTFLFRLSRAAVVPTPASAPSPVRALLGTFYVANSFMFAVFSLLLLLCSFGSLFMHNPILPSIHSFSRHLFLLAMPIFFSAPSFAFSSLPSVPAPKTNEFMCTTTQIFSTCFI